MLHIAQDQITGVLAELEVQWTQHELKSEKASLRLFATKRPKVTRVTTRARVTTRLVVYNHFPESRIRVGRFPPCQDIDVFHPRHQGVVLKQSAVWQVSRTPVTVIPICFYLFLSFFLPLFAWS